MATKDQRLHLPRTTVNHLIDLGRFQQAAQDAGGRVTIGVYASLVCGVLFAVSLVGRWTRHDLAAQAALSFVGTIVSIIFSVSNSRDAKWYWSRFADIEHMLDIDRHTDDLTISIKRTD
jgi:hypothetical protein